MGQGEKQARQAIPGEAPADATKRVTRRRLLGGAAIGATLPVLGELIPHRGLHHAVEGRAVAAGTGQAPGAGGGAGGMSGMHATQAHPAFVGSAVDPRVNGFDPSEIVRDFDWGKTRRLASGRVLREWDLVAGDKEIEVAPGIRFPAWTYNGRVPGPTLRAREDELLRVRFHNGSAHPHTIHFHGIHPALMDGMPGVGERAGGGLIQTGESFTYEFEATPFGMHHYHCHAVPLAEHIAKGLYGAFIVDPRSGRDDADELLMVMNGFDTNFDGANEVYAVNTVGFHYANRPIRVRRNAPVRIYLLNMLEFDQVNSFHIHANFFNYFPTGTRLEPSEYTDVVVQGQGQRGILELSFPHAGRFMFHAHKTEFAELGWLGFFEVEA